MEAILGPLDATGLMLAALVALVAGAIKGMVGFALPTVMITGLTLFMEPPLALAALILSALVTNGMQALRQGIRAAVQGLSRHRVFVAFCLIALAIGAQLITRLSYQTLFLMIGCSVTLFAVIQLVGWRMPLARAFPRLTAAWLGSVAGFVGGFSGIWGPPTVIYLTILDTEKREQMRVQGVIYGLGAATLTLAHLQSGVLNAATAPLSAVLVIPAIIGMWLGTMVQDRVDQQRFRTMTLIVLVVGGLNLIRRGLTG